MLSALSFPSSKYTYQYSICLKKVKHKDIDVCKTFYFLITALFLHWFQNTSDKVVCHQFFNKLHAFGNFFLKRLGNRLIDNCKFQNKTIVQYSLEMLEHRHQYRSLYIALINFKIIWLRKRGAASLLVWFMYHVFLAIYRDYLLNKYFL